MEPDGKSAGSKCQRILGLNILRIHYRTGHACRDGHSERLSVDQATLWQAEDALVTGRDLTLGGNRAILARLGVEETLQKGIREFRSQERVVKGLIEARKGKRCGERVIEVYLAFDPRPSLDCVPYHEAISAIR